MALAVFLIAALVSAVAPAGATQAGRAAVKAGPAAPADRTAEQGGAAAGSGTAVSPISPSPQSVRPRGGGFPVTPVVGLVVGRSTDDAAVGVVVAALEAAGVKRVVRASDDGLDPETPTTVWVGGPGENTSSAGALSALGVSGPDGLADEGYVLAVGRDGEDRARVVLAGVDQAGTFYAAQTFAQLIVSRSGRSRLPGVEIRDWPSMQIRGGMEVHYGPSWSHQDRMSQIAFYGRQKLNLFAYGTTEDPYTQSRWRELYPADKLAQLAEEVALAKRNHVEYRFHIYPAVHEAQPGAPVRICFSDEGDFQALVGKAQQLWDIGVRSFVVGFDDTSTGFRCDQDRQRFGDGPAAAAAAQSYLLNRFNREFLASHDGASRLTTVPSEYVGTATSPYRQRIAADLDPDVIVMWTGSDVVAPTVTAAEAAAASDVFGHDILIFDNYPVNDYARDRLFLGPVQGRDPALKDQVLGLNSNTMNEAEASKIPLFTTADYTWNADAYDPETSWDRAIEAVGGPAHEALRTFAENSRSSILDNPESPVLTPLITELKNSYASGGSAERLLRALRAVQAAPGDLRARLGNPRFLDQAAPYLDKLGFYGAGGQAAVNMLLAQRAGEMEAAWQDRLTLESSAAAAARIPQQIADPYGKRYREPGDPPLFEPFFDWARDHNDSLFRGPVPAEYGEIEATGSPPAADGSSLAAAADGDAGAAYRAARAPRAGDALTVTLPLEHRLDRVVVLQGSGATAQAAVQVRTEDGSWRQVGSLGGAYSSLDAGGLAADAVRLAWSAGSPAPVIHEVIPVYADALPARVTTTDRTFFVPGTTKAIQVKLEPVGDEALSGTLRAVLPEGWTASPAEQGFSLHGDPAVHTIDVTPPADAAKGRYPVRFIAEAPDGRFSSDLLTAYVVSGSSYPARVDASSPVGYWRLGESSGSRMLDSSGNEQHGAFRDGATLGVGGALAGDDDTAVRFDGGYAEVASSDLVSPTGPYTVEAWVKADSLLGGAGQGIVEKYSVPANNGFVLRLDGGGHLQAWNLGASSYALVTGRTTLQTGVWYHVAAVYDGAQLTVYVNGDPDNSTATPVAPAAGPASLKIGARGDDAANRWPGALDEVALYQHALTPEEITTHYLLGRG